VIYQWLEAAPRLNAKQIMADLAKTVPELYGTQSHLRTLQRGLKEWRNERAKKLIYGEAGVELDGHCGVKAGQVSYNFTSNISL